MRSHFCWIFTINLVHQSFLATWAHTKNFWSLLHYYYDIYYGDNEGSVIYMLSSVLDVLDIINYDILSPIFIFCYLHYNVLCFNVLCSIFQCSNVLDSSILCSHVLCSIVPCFNVPCSNVIVL